MNSAFFQNAINAQRNSLEDQVNTFNEKKEEGASEQEALSLFDLPLSTEILKESATSEPMKALYTKLLSKVTGMSEDTAKELIEKAASGDTKDLLNTNLRKLIGDKIQATGDNIKEFKNNLKLEYNKRAQEIKDFKKQKLEETKQKFDDIKKQYDETDDEALKIKLNGQLEEINAERKAIVSKVSEELKSLKAEAQERLDNAIEEYTGYLDKLKSVPSNIVDKFNKFVGNIKDLKAGQGTGGINIDNLKAGLENKLKATVEGIKAKRDELINQTRDEFNKIRSQYNDEEDEDLRTQLKSQMDELKNKIGNIKSDATDQIEDAQEEITNQIKTLSDMAKSKVENLVGDAKDTVNELIDNSRFKGVKDMAGKAVDWWKNFKQSKKTEQVDTDELFNTIKTKARQLVTQKAEDLVGDKFTQAKELLGNAKSKFTDEFSNMEFKPPQDLQNVVDGLKNKLSSAKANYENEIAKTNPNEDLVRTYQEQMRVANNKLVDGQNQIEDIVDNLKQNARSKLLQKFGLKEGDQGLELDVPDVPQAISSAVDNVASKVSSYAEEGINNGLGKLATSVLGPYKEGAIGSRGSRFLGDMLNRLKNPEETLNTIKDQLGQQPRSFIKQVQSQASEIQENINNQLNNMKSSIKIDPNSILSDEQKQMISKAQDAANNIAENASESLNKSLVGNVAKDTAEKVGEDVGEDVAESAAEDVGSSLLDFLLPGIGVAISAGIMGGQIHKLVEEAHKHGNFNPTSASYQIGTG